MQSDVVSGDSCSDNAVRTELSGCVSVPVDETLVKEAGFRREKESEGMEVDNIGEGGTKECLNDKGDAISLKGEMGSLNVVEEGFNDACAEKERDDLVAIEGVINQDNPIKANFNSFSQQLFPNPASVGRSGKKKETKKSIEDRSGEAKIKAATSDKEDYEVDDDKGGFSEHKEVSLVVDLDGKIKKKGKNKGEFCASDLVWGKVRSHPWWPAQIFEAGDASEKARKYFKSKGYFVCYFGDQTFAWNDEATLKPFAPYFSQMVKQSQMESFRHAVNCVLMETSRRVEFGLSCQCIADNAYNQLKNQVVENDGIREQSRIREGGDRFCTAASFEPVKFLHYVKDLAQGPHGDVDRIEHVVARAQMAAFYRWKGIYHLAEFAFLIGYVNNEADAPVTAEKDICEEIVGGNPPPKTIKEDDNRPQKRKKTSNDSGHLTKKVRCLSDLIGKKTIRKEDDKETNKKFGNKSISSSARRQKRVKSFLNDSTPSRTKECNPPETTMKSKDTKPSFRVGESILRVAGQLSQSSPLLKLDVSSHRNTSKDEEA